MWASQMAAVSKNLHHNRRMTPALRCLVLGLSLMGVATSSRDPHHPAANSYHPAANQYHPGANQYHHPAASSYLPAAHQYHPGANQYQHPGANQYQHPAARHYHAATNAYYTAASSFHPGLSGYHGRRRRDLFGAGSSSSSVYGGIQGAPMVNSSHDSVCSRQLPQSMYRTVVVSYTCWTKMLVECSYCSGNCRRIGELCYKLTSEPCYYKEKRYTQEFATHYYCCPGYEQYEYSCKGTLSTSCQHNNGGCDHLCHSDGSGNRRCSCFRGYRLVGGTKCEDINECDYLNGDCNQQCMNVDGGAYCTCKKGFRLKSAIACQDIDECAIANGGCAHRCHNTPGDFDCDCDPGFQLIRRSECVDIDECSDSPCSHICKNMPGTYSCFCPRMHQLNPKDNKTCTKPREVLAYPFTEPRPQATRRPTLGNAQIVSASTSPVDIAIIAGSTVGGVIFISLTLIAVCLLIRRSPSVMARHATDGTASHGGGDGNWNAAEDCAVYQPSHGAKCDGATGGPVPVNNPAYDKYFYENMAQFLPTPAGPRAPIGDPNPPPSYIEATTPTVLPPAPSIPDNGIYIDPSQVGAAGNVGCMGGSDQLNGNTGVSPVYLECGVAYEFRGSNPYMNADPQPIDGSVYDLASYRDPQEVGTDADGEIYEMLEGEVSAASDSFSSFADG